MDKRRALASVAILLLSFPAIPAAAFAQSDATVDPLAGFYGNTLEIKVDGSKEFRFYAADHTFHDRIHGKRLNGVWTIEGDRICIQKDHGAKYCNLGLGKAVGDTWTDRDPYTGNEVKFTLLAGQKADR